MSTPITGYRALSDDEVAIVNVIKDIGNKMGDMFDVMETDPAVDQRWLAIARTDMQKGFMSMVRAVTKPESF